MFLAVPCGILLLTGLVIPVQNRLRENVGLSWLIATVSAGAVLVWSIYSAWIPDQEITLLPTVTVGSYPLVFVFDRSVAALFITLSSVYFMTMVTLVSEFSVDRGIGQFLLLIAIVGVAFLSAASKSIWNFIFCWTLYDLITGSRQFRATGERKDREARLGLYGLRLFAVFLLTVSFAITARKIWLATAASGAAYIPALLAVLAAGIRSGVLPPHQSGLSIAGMPPKAETLGRVIGILIVVPVYLRVEMAGFPPAVLSWLRFFTVLAGIAGCAGWLLSNRSEVGRNFFLLICAVYPLAGALSGSPTAALIFSVVYPIAAIAIYHHFANYVVIRVLLVFFLLLFSGLPFTPAAAGWPYLIEAGISFFTAGLILTQAVAMIGYALSILRPRAYDPGATDRWTRTGFPFTYAILFASGVFAAYTGWGYAGKAGDFRLMIWTGGTIFLFGAFYYRYRTSESYHDLNLWAREVAGRTTVFLIRLIDFSGFGFLTRPAYRLLTGANGLIAAALESEGGLIWEILLLIVILVGVAAGTV